MNICIIEDHLLVAQLLQNLIASNEGPYHIKTYANAVAFLSDDFSAWKPDIILVDIALPDMNGLDMIEQAKKKMTEGKFIVLTSNMDIGIVKSALRKGINGYLTKDASKEELLEAINNVFQGGQYLNRSLKDKIIERQFSQEAEEVNINLSRREKEVLQKLCEGNTHKEIAYGMGLSINTIHHYIKNIMGKLKINRTTELVLFAIQHGFFVPPKAK